MNDPNQSRPLDDALRLLPDAPPREPIPAERRAPADRRRGMSSGTRYVVPPPHTVKQSAYRRRRRLAAAELLGELGKCVVCKRPMSLRGVAGVEGATCCQTCRERLRQMGKPQ